MRLRWVNPYLVRIVLTSHKRNVKRQLLEPVEFALSQPSPGMWDAVLLTFREVGFSAEEQYLTKAKSQSLPTRLRFS